MCIYICTNSEARLRPAHGNDDDADGDGACLARDPLSEFCVLFELLRQLVSLFLRSIQTSVQLRDLLALRLGESLGVEVCLPFALLARLRLHNFLSIWLFLDVIMVLGDDAFHPLACPRAILRARTPIGVLPELDASRWASHGPRVFVDVRQLIGFVFVFQVHVLFIEEVAVHS